MPKAETVSDTNAETPPESEVSQRNSDGRSKTSRDNLPQNSVARLGLPTPRGPRLKFEDFVAYWRQITEDKRKQITVYVYVLFPKLNFPDREHSIAKLPGEFPLTDEEEVLGRFGLGDFHFKMKYSDTGIDKIVVSSWLTGYSDGLPGFSDFAKHPPLYIRDATQFVDVENEKNVKSGFIQWLRSTGQLPGGATNENTKENEMAEVERGAMGRVLEKVVDKAFADPPPPAPVQVQEHQPDQGVAMIREALQTVHEINKQNAVNLPELLRTAADVTRHDPPPPPPPPPDFKPFTDQVASLTSAVIGMHEKRADDMAAQLERQNGLIERILAREQAHGNTRAELPPPVDPMDAIIGKFEQLDRLKTAMGFTPPVVDDDPAPRRRRRFEEDEEEKKGGGIMESIFGNLPSILSAVTTIGGIVATSLHNAAVLKTGEGQAIAPPSTALLPHQAPPFPGPTQAPMQSAMPQYQQQPNPQAQPQSQPQGDPRVNAFAFLAQITPGLLGAFDRAETGYEYAELFIKTYGRPGEFGYEAIKLAGSTPPFGDPAQGFNAQGSAHALAQLLHMYPPIWGRIGNDPRLEQFLVQFVSYDELLRDTEVPNLTKLCIEYEVDSVADYLALPEDDAEGDGEGEGEGDGGAEGADITPNGIAMPNANASAVPQVVPASAAPMRKPKPQPKPVN